MSARGVDKLVIPGRDILLVSGFDECSSRMQLSVLPQVTPRRVSVDAIEHWMIYRQNPDVGAILHACLGRRDHGDGDQLSVRHRRACDERFRARRHRSGPQPGRSWACATTASTPRGRA
jgi:hypothetical protein